MRACGSPGSLLRAEHAVPIIEWQEAQHVIIWPFFPSCLRGLQRNAHSCHVSLHERHRRELSRIAPGRLERYQATHMGAVIKKNSPLELRPQRKTGNGSLYGTRPPEAGGTGLRCPSGCQCGADGGHPCSRGPLPANRRHSTFLQTLFCSTLHWRACKALACGRIFRWTCPMSRAATALRNRKSLPFVGEEKHQSYGLALTCL